MDRLRSWSFAHPKARAALREGWGLSRRMARRAHLPVPFDPQEMRELEEAVHEQVATDGGGPRVLFLSMRGWSTHIMWETTLAHATRLRGAVPVFATCGGRLPICDAANLHSAPPMPCLSCGEYATDGLRRAGFDPLTLRDLVDVRVETAAARARIKGLRSVAACESFDDGDFPVGRLVRISVAWFLARGSLPDTEKVIDTYRRFLVSGQVLHRAFARLLDRVRPDRVVLLNGTFFAESILFELCRRRSIPVVTYERGFSMDSLVISAGRPAADLMVDEAHWQAAAARPLDAVEARLLDQVLDGRTRGEDLSDNFWQRRVEDVARIRADLRLDPSRPLAVLFSNILWDSAVQGKDLGFASLDAWIVETIRGFAERPDVDLVVRLHPAEIRLANHPTEERMGDVIAAQFPVLPANVRVVQPESDISSYSLMAMASLGLVYTSTTGLEMAARGIAVVVTAETHYRRRGFTYDVGSPGEFWTTVDRLLGGRDEAEVEQYKELARRYGALFLLRFMQPLPLVHEESRGRPRLRFTSLADLQPGRLPSLDRICAGILDGAPVVTPVEELR